VDGKAVTLPATHPLRFDWKRTVAPAAGPVTLDGALSEWPADSFTEVTRPMFMKEGWDWKGAADGRFRFAVRQHDGRLLVAVETFDDRVISAAGADELQDRLMLRIRTAAGETTFAGAAGTATENTVVVATATGLLAEFSLPLAAEDRTFHLNVGWLDHDRPENTKPSVLWWRDPAVAEFGEFSLAAP
jgi:hypothetical protein